ncbi:MAG: hypothetical protein SOR72_06805 [Hornefia sp.]|nr:hypothetical protein [Hornefia sp.]
MSKISRNKADKGRKKTSKQAKIALAVLGVGVISGATVVIGLNRIMRKIFINEDWPDEEWSSDDWAGEDLE